jgi:hypothetical protein
MRTAACRYAFSYAIYFANSLRFYLITCLLLRRRQLYIRTPPRCRHFRRRQTLCRQRLSRASQPRQADADGFSDTELPSRRHIDWLMIIFI